MECGIILCTANISLKNSFYMLHGYPFVFFFFLTLFSQQFFSMHQMSSVNKCIAFLSGKSWGQQLKYGKYWITSYTNASLWKMSSVNNYLIFFVTDKLSDSHHERIEPFCCCFVFTDIVCYDLLPLSAQDFHYAIVVVELMSFRYTLTISFSMVSCILLR